MNLPAGLIDDNIEFCISKSYYMIDVKKLKEDLVILRNYHLESLKMLDRRIEELELLSPSNLKHRKNNKTSRVQKYENYLITGKWKNQKEVTINTLK